MVSSAPFGVSAFPGLKVLLVGDTHHGLLSFYNALAYCLKVAWVSVLLCHQSSHIDWFRSILGEDRVLFTILNALQINSAYQMPVTLPRMNVQSSNSHFMVILAISIPVAV